MQRYRPASGGFLIDRGRIEIVLRRIVRGPFSITGHGNASTGLLVPFKFVSIGGPAKKCG